MYVLELTFVIEYGVLYGSVFGPKLYTLYTKPLADVVRHHQLDMHFYADDTQLYVSFENNAPEQQSTAVTRLNTCNGDIRNWLANNMLKLNDDKAGFILRTKIYAVYADHFAHVGRVFSATNADLRRSDRADGKYKHSYNTPTFKMNCACLLKLC